MSVQRVPAGFDKLLQEAHALRALGKVSKAEQAARRAYALAEEHLPSSHPARQLAARTLGMLSST